LTTEIQKNFPPFILAKNNGRMRDFYRILDPPLGAGAYGEVRKCVFKEDMKDKKSSLKQIRAVKILSKAYMEEKDFLSFKSEVECLHGLDHPSILHMYHYFEDPKRFLLVTELCEGGDLYDMVLTNTKLDPRQAAYIIKQLLSAVINLHDNRVVHRDLKPENVLITDTAEEFPEIKLIDFGTAKKFSDGEKFKERIGTLAYMAPEILK
jgi:calcium-dependent protein kinase